MLIRKHRYNIERDPDAPWDPIRLWSTGHKHDGRKVVLTSLAVVLLIWVMWGYAS